MSAPHMQVLPVSVRYGGFFTDEERADLERRTKHEKPLITIHGDRLYIAFDRSDTVLSYPLMRAKDRPAIEAHESKSKWVRTRPRWGKCFGRGFWR